eukprot:5655712-Pyramimonas_sp.AAC.1
MSELLKKSVSFMRPDTPTSANPPHVQKFLGTCTKNRGFRIWACIRALRIAEYEHCVRRFAACDTSLHRKH